MPMQPSGLSIEASFRASYGGELQYEVGIEQLLAARAASLQDPSCVIARLIAVEQCDHRRSVDIASAGQECEVARTVIDE